MKQIDGLELQDLNSGQTVSQDDLKFLNILDEATYQD
jgi:hypothetical protein